MSINESGKTPCDRCNGVGSIGTLGHKNKSYMILCPKCLGKRNLDWIETIKYVHPQRDVLLITCTIFKYALPNNYVFVHGGGTYFLEKEFFEKDLKLSHISTYLGMHHYYLEINPHVLKSWNPNGRWEEISAI